MYWPDFILLTTLEEIGGNADDSIMACPEVVLQVGAAVVTGPNEMPRAAGLKSVARLAHGSNEGHEPLPSKVGMPANAAAGGRTPRAA